MMNSLDITKETCNVIQLDSIKDARNILTCIEDRISNMNENTLKTKEGLNMILRDVASFNAAEKYFMDNYDILYSLNPNEQYDLEFKLNVIGYNLANILSVSNVC